MVGLRSDASRNITSARCTSSGRRLSKRSSMMSASASARCAASSISDAVSAEMAMQILPLFTGGVAELCDNAAGDDEAADADDRGGDNDGRILAALVRSNGSRGPGNRERIDEVSERNTSDQCC